MTVTSFSLLLLRFVMFTSVFQRQCVMRPRMCSRKNVCARAHVLHGARVRAAERYNVRQTVYARTHVLACVF